MSPGCNKNQILTEQKSHARLSSSKYSLVVATGTHLLIRRCPRRAFLAGLFVARRSLAGDIIHGIDFWIGGVVYGSVFTLRRSAQSSREPRAAHDRHSGRLLLDHCGVVSLDHRTA